MLSTFHQVFYSLEDDKVLDPTSESDLSCLHSVYLPKINSALKSFAEGWNKHGITTENNKTPTQLYTCGVLFGNSDISLPNDVSLNDEAYDLDAPSVVLPETVSPLRAHHTAGLDTLLNHNRDSDSSADFSIDIYLAVRSYIHAYCN